MIPQEIIRKKRDKKVLLKEEISLFVKGLTDGSFSDSQVAAMSMAIFLNGMISHIVSTFSKKPVSLYALQV